MVRLILGAVDFQRVLVAAVEDLGERRPSRLAGPCRTKQEDAGGAIGGAGRLICGVRNDELQRVDWPAILRDNSSTDRRAAVRSFRSLSGVSMGAFRRTITPPPPDIACAQSARSSLTDPRVRLAGSAIDR